MTIYDGFACIKSVLFILNILFVISGIVVLLLGICVNSYFNDYETFVDDRYLYAPEFLIILGTIIFSIAILGCYGTIKEDPCLTLMFSTFLLLVFCIEIAIGAAGYLMREKAESLLLQQFDNAMVSYGSDPIIVNDWDEMQANFNCCGIRGPEDWARNNLTMPVSCCDFPEDGPLGEVPCGNSDLHQVGCLDVFVQFVRMNARFIQVIGLTLALMQLAGIMCSCYLSYGYRKGYEVI